MIKTFKQIAKKDVSIAGGKGASLGEMTKADMPVPNGFVVTARTFEHFLEDSDLKVEIDAILRKVRHTDINSVQEASEKIVALISNAQIPKDISGAIMQGFKRLNSPHVAVRSSATAEDSKIASWAGELESYLNVDDKNLLESVKKCWASLFTPRAIFYRFEKKLYRQGISVAVVVQTMVQADVSGIAFTVHPVTEDRDQMVIEAGLGLGEAIVGGLITPDTYVIGKKKLSIMDLNVGMQRMAIVRSKNGTKEKIILKSLGSKQKLTDAQIIRLAKLCLSVEKHYRAPQDIEWAMSNKGRFYILQSRPITTLL